MVGREVKERQRGREGKGRERKKRRITERERL